MSDNPIIRVDVTEEEIAEIQSALGADFGDAEDAAEASAPLGRKEYCAVCTSDRRRGEQHNIFARNWLFAVIKAGRACGGSFSMSRGRCR